MATKIVTEPTENHTDVVGRLINIGDYVAAPYWNGQLRVCKVIGLTQKMIKLEMYLPKSISLPKEFNAYAKWSVLLDKEDVLMFTIKGR
jgi:hypothetical protein